MDPSVFRLAVTIIRIREWISARRTANALADITSFSDNSRIVEEIPSAYVSEWLETIYDQDEQLERLANEALRLEAEEDVDRLLESDWWVSRTATRRRASSPRRWHSRPHRAGRARARGSSRPRSFGQTPSYRRRPDRRAARLTPHSTGRRPTPCRRARDPGSRPPHLAIRKRLIPCLMLCFKAAAGKFFFGERKPKCRPPGELLHRP
jgi:hypothetical protein